MTSFWKWLFKKGNFLPPFPMTTRKSKNEEEEGEEEEEEEEEEGEEGEENLLAPRRRQVAFSGSGSTRQ